MNTLNDTYVYTEKWLNDKSCMFFTIKKKLNPPLIHCSTINVYRAPAMLHVENKTPHHNLEESVKAMLRGKVIAVKIYIKKERWRLELKKIEKVAKINRLKLKRSIKLINLRLD